MTFETQRRELASSPAPSFPRPLLFLFPTTTSTTFSLSLSLPVSSLRAAAMHRRLHQPHVPPSGSPAPSDSSDDAKRGKKRGSYNCGRCGLPKKGHSCHAGSSSADSSAAAASSTPVSAAAAAASSCSSASASVVAPPPSLSSSARPPQPPPLLPRHPISHLRRAPSFDDLDVRADEGEDFDEVEPDLDEREQDFVDGDADVGGLPTRCLWEVLRRLPPAELLAAARVCKGWRETSRRVWRAAEDLKLRVPSRAQLCFVGSVLNKCPDLVRLSLRMERLGLGHGFRVWYSDLGCLFTRRIEVVDVDALILRK